MRIRILVLFLTLLLFPYSHAMEKAIVVLKSGERIACEAERIIYANDRSKLSIKRAPNSKSEKIQKEEIDTVMYFYKDGSIQVLCSFPYVSDQRAAKNDFSHPISTRFGEWLQLVKKGHLSLFYTDHTMDRGREYYLKKEDTDYAIELYDNRGRKINKKSKKAISNYLSNCPKLSAYILNNDIETEEVEDIVDEYNKWIERQTE